MDCKLVRDFLGRFGILLWQVYCRVERVRRRNMFCCDEILVEENGFRLKFERVLCEVGSYDS